MPQEWLIAITTGTSRRKSSYNSANVHKLDTKSFLPPAVVLNQFCCSQRFKPLLNFVKTSSGQQTLHFIDATWCCIAVLFSDDTKPHAVSIIRVSRELMMNLLVMPAACQLVSHYTAVVLSYCCFMPNLLRPNNCAPKSEHISYGRLLLPRQAQVTNQ